MVREALPWRRATADDAVALRDLERRANLTGLGHVFGPLPFPDEAVLARWRDALAEPGVVTEVVDGERGLVVAVCGDGSVLRQLMVEPATWGLGMGEAGVARFRERVPGRATLWCLERNHRAQALYARLGWTPTGTTRPTPWPVAPGRPAPVEVQLSAPAAPAAPRARP